MSGTVPVTASQLLPRDLQERFKTGEVLELEFKLIHGAEKWDPEDRVEDKERAEFIGKATAHMRDDPAEAERLALHAWSVRNLPGGGQAALCLPAAESAVPPSRSVFCKDWHAGTCCRSFTIYSPSPAAVISRVGLPLGGTAPRVMRYWTGCSPANSANSQNRRRCGGCVLIRTF